MFFRIDASNGVAIYDQIARQVKYAVAKGALPRWRWRTGSTPQPTTRAVPAAATPAVPSKNLRRVLMRVVLSRRSPEVKPRMAPAPPRR